MAETDVPDAETFGLADAARTIHLMLSDPEWAPSMLEDARKILAEAGLVEDVPGVDWPRH